MTSTAGAWCGERLQAACPGIVFRHASQFRQAPSKKQWFDSHRAAAKINSASDQKCKFMEMSPRTKMVEMIDSVQKIVVDAARSDMDRALPVNR